MPAAEIGSAVIGVQIPVKIDRGDLPDGFFGQQLLDLSHIWAPTVVEAYEEAAVIAAFGIENGLAFPFVGGQRLFGEHVAAHVQTLDDKLMMGGILGGHDHQVGFYLVDHFLETGEDRAVDAHVLPGVFQAPGVYVAKTDEFQQVRVLIYQPLSPERGAADAGPDQDHPQFFIGIAESERRNGEHTAGCQHAYGR